MKLKNRAMLLPSQRWVDGQLQKDDRAKLRPYGHEGEISSKHHFNFFKLLFNGDNRKYVLRLHTIHILTMEMLLK